MASKGPKILGMAVIYGSPAYKYIKRWSVPVNLKFLEGPLLWEKEVYMGSLSEEIMKTRLKTLQKLRVP